MGSPVSPIVCNLYMENFEKIALSSAPSPPSMWLRYVDDTFVKIHEYDVDGFTAHINSIDRNIQFTTEPELNPLDPIEISENRSEILKSPFLTKYGSIWFFHNTHCNLFNIEYLSLQVTFILIKIELPTKWYRTRPCILHTYY